MRALSGSGGRHISGQGCPNPSPSVLLNQRVNLCFTHGFSTQFYLQDISSIKNNENLWDFPGSPVG